MQRTPHQMERLRRFRESFREGKRNLHDRARAQTSSFRSKIRNMKRTPRWVKIMKKTYHEYGLKHVLLISILILYQFLGAVIFYFIEVRAETDKEHTWNIEIEQNRTIFLKKLVPSMFNNTDFLFFLSAEQSEEIYDMLERNLKAYELQLGIKYTDQKIRWDFWNAMLYAGTVCTTIGYGHLYPITTAGRVMTMVYAIFGIPLVLSILDDLGKLLTKCLKYPWLFIKMGCRRLFRYCTQQSMEDIRRVDQEDFKGLAIFDLPIPVAIGVVVGWIFICSATFCIWEEDWDYFLAFYFFFISLSTIGLGDIVPSQPKYLLMLFGYIIIGLSLVSMCVNLIQAKLEQTYEAGQEDLSEYNPDNPDLESDPPVVQHGLAEIADRHVTTLGVFKHVSNYSLCSRASNTNSPSRKRSSKLDKQDKVSQTLLSFPSPSHKPRSGAFKALFANGSAKGRVLPSSLSIDDVMRLVDTEEDDVIILAQLTNQFNMDANNVQIDTHTHLDQDIEDSRSYTGLLAHQSEYELEDIEEIEEEEDRILLRPASASDEPEKPRRKLAPIPEASTQNEKTEAEAVVHFRSRISIIPPTEKTALIPSSSTDNPEIHLSPSQEDNRRASADQLLDTSSGDTSHLHLIPVRRTKSGQLFDQFREFFSGGKK